MEDETQATSVEEDGAPAATDEAASEVSGAPAQTPDGFIEEKRYQDLRSNHDRINSLLDRAKSGDNDALRELIGAEFAQDETEDPDPGDEQEPVEDPRIAAHDEWIQQQQVERTLNAFNAHLDKLAGDPQLLDEYDRQAILNASVADGFNEAATEKAFSAWQEREKAREKKIVEQYRKSKKAPHVSQAGTGATEEVLPLDASHRDRVAHMTEQLNLAKQQ